MRKTETETRLKYDKPTLRIYGDVLGTTLSTGKRGNGDTGGTAPSVKTQ